MWSLSKYSPFDTQQQQLLLLLLLLLHKFNITRYERKAGCQKIETWRRYKLHVIERLCECWKQSSYKPKKLQY
jgi:hypothetical protein